MPTYPHNCSCGNSFDVVKTIAERDSPELCPKCNSVATRERVVRTIVHSSAGDWNRVEFNPGLGCWTKSNKHAAEIAKSKGLEPVGTEKPETIHKHFEKQREDTRKQRWVEADREKVYD